MWPFCEPRRGTHRSLGLPSPIYRKTSRQIKIRRPSFGSGKNNVVKPGDRRQRVPQVVLQLVEAFGVAGGRQQLLEAGWRRGRFETSLKTAAQDLRQIVQKARGR